MGGHRDTGFAHASPDIKKYSNNGNNETEGVDRPVAWKTLIESRAYHQPIEDEMGIDNGVRGDDEVK